MSTQCYIRHEGHVRTENVQKNHEMKMKITQVDIGGH